MKKMSLSRILVPTDFSNSSKEALDSAIHLARMLKAKLYLLHVFEWPVYIDAGVSPGVRPEMYEWIKEIKTESSRKLARLAEEVRRRHVTVHTLFKEGAPFLEILDAAKDIRADLIVVGTHGRTGLAHILLGSVAERVVRQSPCPVLTVRPKALRGKRS
jgi:universal stress protein A